MNKSYEPKSFENKIYSQWQEKKLFKATVNKEKKPFSIVMPPPNITGQLHMGHALNDTIQDAITRYKRMKGFEALWLPGTDHASIATEVKIVEKLKHEGKSKEAVGRDGFLKEAFEWNDVYGGRIVEQIKQLGCSCDWDRQAFTMDEKCSKAVRHVFVKLYEKGLIYQGDKMINRCTDCNTALSDAEVEHKESDSFLYYIKYPIKDSSEFITVATTRPETMLGDTAVAVAPDDKRYKNVVGKFIQLPLTDRLIPIIADSYVDKEFGTGAVKITPAHDPNDFEVGTRNNLEFITIMNENGFLNSNAGAYEGINKVEARKVILSDLENQGFLLKKEKHINNIGHCYRCDSVVEPLISKQWFVKMEELAKPAIDVVKNGDVKFLPKKYEKTYFHWMENIRDWCISRQLWWGHRIPAFYCEDGHMTVSENDIDVCPVCGKKVKQDEDVLDTWFSSALWPFSTLGYPDKTADLDYFYPTDVLVTAYDIIFFWVARMVFSGLEHMDEIPFKYVYINGLVRDEQGRKMSKSLNNGVDPLEVIDEYGTDSLRYSLLNGNGAGSDIRFSKERIDSYRNFMNKIWNASRFVLLNVQEDFHLLDISKIKKLSLADKWILTKLNDVTLKVTKDYDKFDIGYAAENLYSFVWNDFCDWYIELSKTTLYGQDKEEKNITINVLLYALRAILKLLHPIVPFITEEIYQNLPNKDAEFIMVSEFPTKIKAYKKDADGMTQIMEVIKSIRNMRATKGVSQSKRTALYIEPKDGFDKVLKTASNYIEKLACGNSVEFSKTTQKSAEVITPIANVYIPLGELIDYEKELIRLKEELAKVESELTRAEGKLKNQGFVAKAPKKLIDEENAKIQKYADLKQNILKSIEEMSNN